MTNDKGQMTNSRLGRSAALIHGVSLLSAALTALAVWLLPAPATDAAKQADAILGVGGSAAIIFALWSATLAGRALWRGEARFWPLAVFGLLLIEFNIPCVLIWPLLSAGKINEVVTFAISLGLPVFVPFFTLATFIAAPIAWWRAGKGSGARGASPPSLGGKGAGGLGLRWYCAIILLLAVLVLPWPLFLFCVLSTGTYGPEHEQARNWRERVADHTPDFVRDRVADWVKPMLSWTRWTPTWTTYVRMTQNGWMSKSRLLAELDGKNATTDLRHCALSGLYWTDPPAALKFAQEKVDEMSRRYGNTEIACATIARYGSADLVRHYLDPKTKVPYGFRAGLIEDLHTRRRDEFRPDLENYCFDASYSGSDYFAARRWLDERKR